ncbi:MAG: bifunctional UDP-N-acetylglucosamine diphosphorylase/glucosamine-1-phosphate N-acetyltransferase GlmU [Pseudomonadota bacterium]
MMNPHILILAAGQGKRMHSSLPKVLHPVLFHPMLHHVIDLSFSLPHSSISLVVGHGKEAVVKSCSAYPKLQFFEQTEQKGTAHAVGVAKDFLKTVKGHVVILSGDVCLLRKESLEALIREHSEKGNALTFTTAFLDAPRGYGRVLRNEKCQVVGIREEADATEAEKKIKEINAGIYCFEIGSLLSALEKIKSGNKQGEYYLTDAIELLIQEGKKVVGLGLADSREIHGVNDRKALSLAENILQERTNERFMLSGVTIHLPETVLIDPKSEIAPDVVIGPGTQISQSHIQKGAVIEGHCRIHDCRIEESAHIKQGSYLEGSVVGKEAKVGPYAHLRPESKLSRGVKIGNFVEVKKSTIGEDSKASHLSYIGDAKIGKNVNLGCGFITCNYDGKKKHKTIIEDEVFIGSDSQIVAPLTVGQGSYVASGSTLTKDVPADSLALSRTRQENKLGYAKRFRKANSSES